MTGSSSDDRYSLIRVATGRSLPTCGSATGKLLPLSDDWVVPRGRRKALVTDSCKRARRLVGAPPGGTGVPPALE